MLTQLMTLNWKDFKKKVLEDFFEYEVSRNSGPEFVENLIFRTLYKGISVRVGNLIQEFRDDFHSMVIIEIDDGTKIYRYKTIQKSDARMRLEAACYYRNNLSEWIDLPDEG